MNTQKIILSILGLGIIVGIGLLVFGANNKKEQTNIGEPVKPAEIPVDTGGNGAGSLLEFNKIISFKLNDKFTFVDGLEITLKEINDSRCPKGVQCVWAGEISGLFAFSGGSLSAPKEIRLGTLNNKSVTLEGYTVSLQGATENSLNIEVMKN